MIKNFQHASSNSTTKEGKIITIDLIPESELFIELLNMNVSHLIPEP